MYTVKEVAQMQGCSETIIYRHIRNHKELNPYVFKEHGKTMINKQGFEILKELMKPINTVDTQEI